MCPETSDHKIMIRRECTGWLLGKLAVLLLLLAVTVSYDEVFLAGNGSLMIRRAVFAAACFVVLIILTLIKIDFPPRTARILNVLLGFISIPCSVVMSDEIMNRAVMDELMSRNS